MRILLVLTMILMGGPILAQAPAPAPAPAPGPVAPEPDPQVVIVGPTNLVDPDNTIVIDASKSVSSYPLQWSSAPPVTIIEADKQKRESVYGFVAPPLTPDTQYIITIMALGKGPDGSPTGKAGTYVFRTKPKPKPVPDPVPAPKPDPSPTPNPPPAPDPVPAPVVLGKLRATLVYPDGDELTRVIRAETDMKSLLAPYNCEWATINDQAVAIDRTTGQPRTTTLIADLGLAPWYARGNGSPVLFIQDFATGKLIRPAGKTEPDGLGFQSPAPTSPDTILATIKSLRGAK